MNDKPLIVHVLYRLDTGGMERIVVSLINATRDRYRHAVICAGRALAPCGTKSSTRRRACLSLDKKPGKDWRCYFRFWRVLRTSEAGSRADLQHRDPGSGTDRETGWGAPSGSRRTRARCGRPARRKLANTAGCVAGWRRSLSATSRCLRTCKTGSWSVRAFRRSKVMYIANGIDVAAVRPCRVCESGAAPAAGSILRRLAPCWSAMSARLDEVKDQAGLISAFKLLCDALPGERQHLPLDHRRRGAATCGAGAQIARTWT